MKRKLSSGPCPQCKGKMYRNAFPGQKEGDSVCDNCDYQEKDKQSILSGG